MYLGGRPPNPFSDTHDISHLKASELSKMNLVFEKICRGKCPVIF
jgi:hypothetical protein